MKYGLFTGLALTLYEAVRFTADIQGGVLFGLLDIAILAVGIAAAHRAYKGLAGGFMSYGTGLGLGSAASGVAGAIAGAYVFIYLRFINSEAFSEIYEQQRVAMQDKGASAQELEIMKQITEIVQSPPVMFISVFVSYLFTGFIFSLIIAAITKRDNPEEEL